MKGLNFNIDKEFKLYTFKQIIFIAILGLFFFILFYFNFGLVMASFILWTFLVFGVLILYLDIKFTYKLQKFQDELDNIKFIIKNERGKK